MAPVSAGRSGASPEQGPVEPGGGAVGPAPVARPPGATGSGPANCAGQGSPAALRRLTRAEYGNTVHDLLGIVPVA